jgi:peptide/nickel transport system substrate-binding protein
MRPRLAAKLIRFITVAALAGATLVPSAVRAGEEPLILRVGTDQDLRILNPWLSITYADYEVFQLQYDLLVSFDNNLQPAPGFADAWESSEDGLTHTFNIREDMLWSDGEPADCEDARYTYQLVLDAVDTTRGYLGGGYLDPYLLNAGLESVSCTDDHTFVATTEFATTLLTQAYIPILPEHIWSDYSIDQISRRRAEGFFRNAPPVVGTGPYVAIEWQPNVFIRFGRNPNYWGEPGVADEIIFEHFTGSDTMVQALRSGELDYVRGTGPDLFDAIATEPNIRVSEGYANGFTMLSMNTRATQEGYNGSTSALEDLAFRDAIGFAIDRQALVDEVLNGHGVAGSTHVPPYHVNWHVEPTNPRTFDIDEANRRLDAAGYTRGGDGRRVDEEGQPIVLRLTWPSSEDHSSDADFIRLWLEQVGIGVDPFVTDEGALIEALYGPETDSESTADWDMYIWGWGGDPDPQSLLGLFTTDQIETGVNDCFYSDDRYDELFTLQQRATDEAVRKQHIAEMQNLFYDAACYHILYYDSELHAQRTDKFTGWVNQPPDTGTPLFGFGYSGYLALQDASAAPTAGPQTPGPTLAPGETAGPVATPAATPVPGNTGGSGGIPPLAVIGVIALIVILAAGFWFMRRRGPRVEVE